MGCACLELLVLRASSKKAHSVTGQEQSSSSGFAERFLMTSLLCSGPGNQYLSGAGWEGAGLL